MVVVRGSMDDGRASVINSSGVVSTVVVEQRGSC